MPVQKARELHGLKEVLVVHRRYIRFHDESLTEEKKEQNRIWERDANIASRATSIRVQSARPKLEYTETEEELTLSEKIRIAKTRLRDASLGYQNDIGMLGMLDRFLIDRAIGRPKDYPELDTPEFLCRAFKGGCHGRHSPELGFRSSNQPLTSPSYCDGTLLDSLLVDKDASRNQCEGSQPSDLIALSDSPSRA